MPGSRNNTSEVLRKAVASAEHVIAMAARLQDEARRLQQENIELKARLDRLEAQYK